MWPPPCTQPIRGSLLVPLPVLVHLLVPALLQSRIICRPRPTRQSHTCILVIRWARGCYGSISAHSREDFAAFRAPLFSAETGSAWVLAREAMSPSIYCHLIQHLASSEAHIRQSTRSPGLSRHNLALPAEVELCLATAHALSDCRLHTSSFLPLHAHHDFATESPGERVSLAWWMVDSGHPGGA